MNLILCQLFVSQNFGVKVKVKNFLLLNSSESRMKMQYFSRLIILLREHLIFSLYFNNKCDCVDNGKGGHRTSTTVQVENYFITEIKSEYIKNLLVLFLSS